MPSFFLRTTATNVWKSMTSVSSGSAKRGRGKGTSRVRSKDLNKGQQIGVGRRSLVLPGLNTKIIASSKPQDVQEVGVNDEFVEKLKQVRKEIDTFKRYHDMPLERGWSGRRAHGKKAGPPDDHNETAFEDFDSTVLMLRSIQSMSGIYGRVKRLSAIVVTGNKNGLAGFAEASGRDTRAVIRHARNKAGQNLVYIPRWEDHTVMHDFFSRYYYTTVFVERKPRGYGIRAHRVIRAICEMFGITDLYAKVEGVADNTPNLTKAFFLGLMNQRNYHDMANEKQLHLVDVREENYFYPQVLASPKDRVKSDEELKSSGENLDFTYYIYDGRIKMVTSKKKPFYETGPTWEKHLDRLDYEKNREKTKLLLAAKYGNRRVLDVFPYFRTTADSFNKPEEIEQ